MLSRGVSSGALGAMRPWFSETETQHRKLSVCVSPSGLMGIDFVEKGKAIEILI